MPVSTPKLLIGAVAVAGLAVTAFLTTGANADAELSYHFDAPYQCDRIIQVTRQSTGEERDFGIRSVYFPSIDRRIDLRDIFDDKGSLSGRGIALVRERGVRYEGLYRGTAGGVESINLVTAWPQDDTEPDFSILLEENSDVSQCVELTQNQMAVFQLEGLGELEVMGQ